MAILSRPISDKLIIYSDRGVQYACTKFTAILGSLSGKVTQSTSRKDLILRGKSTAFGYWDNAAAESLFKSLKVEWTYKNQYNHYSDTEISIFKSIETWYNRNRRHSALNYKTINELELEIKYEQLAA